MRYNTVLYDLDGTLLDTTRLVKESFVYAFDKFFPGYELSDDELNSFIGPTLQKSFSHYTDHQQDIDELIHLYREHNLVNHDKYVTQFPHVNDVINKLNNMGIKLAIVTSKKVEVARLGLDIAGLNDKFKVIIGFDEVENHKPEPDSVLLAMKLLDSSPEKTIMVGDNDSDIIAGKKANVLTVGVSWAHNLDRLKKAKPDIMIHDMNDIFGLIEEE